MKNGQGAAACGVEVGKSAKICILYLPDIQRGAKGRKFPGFIPRGYKPCIGTIFIPFNREKSEFPAKYVKCISGYKPCITRYIKGSRKYL